MPRAEAGSTKHLANRMKAKGLQRLRWYCTPCNKQCRDENGFKCHVNSESHVRQMQVVGEDPKKAINEFSTQFQRAFIQQLRTAHGTKPIHINHFYQEYIADKEHIHMNATKWPSLTEFAKFLGREGLCRVEETEKGIHIAWIDNSPEALRRQEALRKRERMDKGDEEREQRLVQEQIDRAREAARSNGLIATDSDADSRALNREDNEKIRLSFGSSRNPSKLPTPPGTSDEENSGDDRVSKDEDANNEAARSQTTMNLPLQPQPAPVKMTLGAGSVKSKNVFASAKKRPSGSKKDGSTFTTPLKKVSEVERIAKEGQERLDRKRISSSSHDSAHEAEHKKRRL